MARHSRMRAVAPVVGKLAMNRSQEVGIATLVSWMK
jgi:hypothetical protein